MNWLDLLLIAGASAFHVKTSTTRHSICEGDISEPLSSWRKPYTLNITYSSPDVIDDLLEQHPVLDGHNDLPYVIRQSLSNEITDGRYDYRQNLKENPADWQTGPVMTDYPGQAAAVKPLLEMLLHFN